MSDPIVYGFPRSTYVNIVRLILTYKDVAYSFHDLEPVMGKPDHLSLHPFNRVPILKHGDFTVYETSHCVLRRPGIPRAAADAAGRPTPGANESMDQRGQFLLLSLYDLPRDA